jgi:hypothetical protein
LAENLGFLEIVAEVTTMTTVSMCSSYEVSPSGVKIELQTFYVQLGQPMLTGEVVFSEIA